MLRGSSFIVKVADEELNAPTVNAMPEFHHIMPATPESHLVILWALCQSLVLSHCGRHARVLSSHVMVVTPEFLHVMAATPKSCLITVVKPESRHIMSVKPESHLVTSWPLCQSLISSRRGRHARVLSRHGGHARDSSRHGCHARVLSRHVMPAMPLSRLVRSWPPCQSLVSTSHGRHARVSSRHIMAATPESHLVTSRPPRQSIVLSRCGRHARVSSHNGCHAIVSSRHGHPHHGPPRIPSIPVIPSPVVSVWSSGLSPVVVATAIAPPEVAVTNTAPLEAPVFACELFYMCSLLSLCALSWPRRPNMNFLSVQAQPRNANLNSLPALLWPGRSSMNSLPVQYRLRRPFLNPLSAQSWRPILNSLRFLLRPLRP